MRDEVRLDLDEDKLDTWEDVRGDYALDPDSEVARPATSVGDELEMAPDGTSADPTADDDDKDGDTGSHR